MPNESFFNRTADLLTPKQWLGLALASGLLALVTAMYLWVHAGHRLPGLLGTAFDRVELFVRDTIRLTFRLDKGQGKPPLEVFAAPLGLLDERASFVWVTQYEDPEVAAAVAPAAEGAAPVHPLARMLDPAWVPAFTPPKLED